MIRQKVPPIGALINENGLVKGCVDSVSFTQRHRKASEDHNGGKYWQGTHDGASYAAGILVSLFQTSMF